MGKRLKSIVLALSSVLAFSSPADAGLKENHVHLKEEKRVVNLNVPSETANRKEFLPKARKKRAKSKNLVGCKGRGCRRSSKKYSFNSFDAYNLLKTRFKMRRGNAYLDLESFVLHSKFNYRAVSLGCILKDRDVFIDGGFSVGRYSAWGIYASMRYKPVFLDVSYVRTSHYKYNDGLRTKVSAKIKPVFLGVEFGISPWDKFYDKKHWGKKDVRALGKMHVKFDENKIFYPLFK
jgi:hypothetical protein